MILTASQHSKIVKRIFLNGEDITQTCMMVDTEKGYAVVCDPWPPKRVNGELKTKALTGQIDVEFVPEAQAMFDMGGKLED